MSPGLADTTRQQLPQIQSMIAKLGTLQSMSFKGVGPSGPDLYALGIDGEIEAANARAVELEATASGLRPRLQEIDSPISAELARGPVGSVYSGVVSGKELIWSKSYGNADMEEKLPADTDTVWAPHFTQKFAKPRQEPEIVRS